HGGANERVKRLRINLVVLMYIDNSATRRTAQPLRALLLALPLDVDLPLLAPDLRALPLELVAVEFQLVLHGKLVIQNLPHGGKSQSIVLQFHVLEVRLLLVRPAHRPGKFVAVFLDRQGGRQLQPTDLVLAIPRPDRVCLVALRARKAAEPEYQRCRKDRLHDRLQERGGGKLSDANRLHPVKAILGMPRPTVRMAWQSAGSGVRRSHGRRDRRLVRASPERLPEVIRQKGSVLSRAATGTLVYHASPIARLSAAQRPRSAAGPAEGTKFLRKPTCRPGRLQRLVRRPTRVRPGMR